MNASDLSEQLEGKLDAFMAAAWRFQFRRWCDAYSGIPNAYDQHDEQALATVKQCKEELNACLAECEKQLEPELYEAVCKDLLADMAQKMWDLGEMMLDALRHRCAASGTSLERHFPDVKCILAQGKARGLA